MFTYLNVNLKQNKLNKNHQEINMRSFNWNLKNFVPLYMSCSFKRNKQKRYKEIKFPWEYTRAMQNSFTDSTILCLCPEAAKWSKDILSLKKKSVISLNVYSQAWNRKLSRMLNNSIQDRSKEFLQNKNNNNRRISWKSHRSQWSLHNKYGQSKAKDWW